MTKSIGEEFMEKTRYKYSLDSDQSKGLPQPPLTLPNDGEANVIDLSNPRKLRFNDTRLKDAIENRKTLRKYADQPLSQDELSYLLWHTQGVKEVVSRPATLRTVPSAGARHPFETYLMLNNVEGIKPGLYRYLAIEHKLMEVNTGENIGTQVADACFNQPMMTSSAAIFIWVAVAYRTKWRYGERSYRYLHLDAGHICQNLYLSAEDINSGVCAIAAFEDDDINGVLGLDGIEKFVVYLATIGKKI